MPVQPSRISLIATLSLVTLLGVGCAKTELETQTPELEQREAELTMLRRENAQLRTQVQVLEERVRLAETSGTQSTSLGATGYDSYGSVTATPAASEDWDEDGDEGPRQLPVVRLTPKERGIDRGGAQPASKPRSQPSAMASGSGSIALSPVPHSGAPEDAGGAYVVDARGGGEDYGYDPSVPTPVYDEAPSGDTASYRLVGSKLVEATQRKPSIGGSKSSDRDTGVVKDYKAAMAVYRDGRYAEAEQAFAAIVAAHPTHDYADNALYWQGEAAYDQAHYADALAAFTKVVERYGGGNKAPDALLKIGLCYGRLGDAANARDVLTQLVAAYPRADASKIAKRKLDELGG